MAAKTPIITGTSLVTGAGSGIGQAAAYKLAEYGCPKIAISDISLEKLEETAAELKSRHPDVEVLKLHMDVASEVSVDQAIADTVEAFGRLDVAVNNAGIAGPRGLAPEVKYTEWRNLMDINLHGVWLCQRAEIKQMMKQVRIGWREGRGTIINVASMYGIVGVSSSELPATAYSAAKHAVIGLTKSEANTFAPQGIRINVICPGYVETALLRPLIKSGVMNDEIDKTPMKRVAQTEEIGDCIAFLASNMGSFMSGSALVVDGGYTSK